MHKKQFFKKGIAMLMTATLLIGFPNISALADSSQIVTLGADLTEDQKEKMFEYFGVQKNEVVLIEINNKEEREYLKGIATEQQIGKKTYSCAYIMPTNQKMINVKTANLTWVSTNMIANTLVTAGIDSCDVIAASPIQVSGTGALTGIIKAYETGTEKPLDEDKKTLAMEELFDTAQLADEIGEEKASAFMNEVKSQVMKDKLTDEDKIAEVMAKTAEHYQVSIPEANSATIQGLMSKIGNEDYDYKALEETMEHLQDKLLDHIDDVKGSLMESNKGMMEKIGDFFGGIITGIGNFFTGIFHAIGNIFTGKKTDNTNEGTTENIDPNSILNNVNESIFDTSSTKAPAETTPPSKEDDTTKEEATAAPTTEPTITEAPSTNDNVIGAEETQDSFSTNEE